MADAEQTLKILVQIGVIGEAELPAIQKQIAAMDDASKEAGQSSEDMAKKMGVVTVSGSELKQILEKTGEATGKGTEKFVEHRRELREVGNELGRASGLGRLGGLALGGLAAAAFAAGKAVEFLKDTWDEIQNTIKGPIEIGLPENAPAHISAAATAWNQYAEARAKVIASSQGAEAGASAQEKALANELKLVKEVLAAEKEKALADLEMNKDQMSPEAYQASRANIGNIFDEAGTSADQKNRRALIANKYTEAASLEIDARNKTQAALAIKAAPPAVAEKNQKTLDENAAAGETAKKEITERLAMIKRLRKADAGNKPTEYEGFDGYLRQLGEGAKFFQRYGYTVDTSGAQKQEEHRLTQAQAQIDTAAEYRKRQAENSSKQSKLMEEAGTESGKAANLRAEAAGDTKVEARQNAVDAHVAALHQSSASKIAGASTQTVTAVAKFTAAAVGGFADVHKQFSNHQTQLDDMRRQIQSLARTR
jgi:hypothetical protein